ncbi:MAG: DUF4351 domain-containing protein [Magnetococcales bacterium]|nr:DUF4351 domain-containing protein [Magnetococcales bacterium]
MSTQEGDKKHPNDEFDVPWKEIIETYFKDFLAFFLPIAHDDIDWESGYEFLDTELARITREAKVGDRRMDKLVKVWRRDGNEYWVLIHIEIQGDRKRNFAEGMYIYHYRAYDLYQRPVVSLAILADGNIGWRPTEFGYELWGTRQSYQFTAVKLLDYSKTDLKESSNLFAVVTLAHLHAKKTKHRMKDRYQEKVRLIRGLYKQGFNRQQIIDLFHFIDWVMHLPKELAEQLRSEIVEFEENQNMPYISSIERIGEKRGEKRGKQEGKAETLLQLLQRRFGAVPEPVRARVASANLKDLEIWLDRIFEADSAQAVLQ